MVPRMQVVEVTTDASGNATAYTARAAKGPILSVIYVKDDFDNGVDFEITTELSGQTVWDEDDVNTSKTVAPRQPTHGTDGTASLYAGGGEPVEDFIYAAFERIKIVVASGGNVKSGTFKIIHG